MSDGRARSYDHEPIWARLASEGAEGWDDRCGSCRDQGSYRAVDAFLASGLAPPPGSSALDVGCGGGQVLERLVARGYRAQGFDYSESAVTVARRNLARWQVHADVRVGDAVVLDFVDDESIDLVVDNHVLHCLVEPTDRHGMLSRCAAVLRAGGVLFSETMSREGDFDPARFDVDPTTGISGNRRRIWTSAASLDGELRRAGFTIAHAETCPPTPEDGAVGDLLIRWCVKRA